MNIRILMILALVASAVAIWFYRSQDPMTLSVPDVTPQSIDYEASGIQAVGTDDKGQVKYTLNAERVVHQTDSNQDQLHNVTVTWQRAENQTITLSANLAVYDSSTQKIVMQDEVVLTSDYGNASDSAKTKGSPTQPSSPTSIPTSAATAPATDTSSGSSAVTSAITPSTVSMTPAKGIKVVATQLVGDLAADTVWSDSPIKVTQGSDKFVAGGFKANILTGDYEFNKVEMTFSAPTRRDQPLF